MTTNNTLKMKVRRNVDGLKQQLRSICYQMYKEPEIGFEEEKSSKLLTRFLEQNGFSVETGLCQMPTSFKAIRKGQTGGPTIAILAEYDALPEIGHGCGHNIIGTAAAGAGAALAPLMNGIQGNLVILGSPAEEGGVDNAGGKVHLVEGGVFENIDAALMFHPSTGSDVVLSSSNARVAMQITFHGKTAHAAGAPHEGINALDAAILTFNNWNALRQHLKEDVRIHGIITKGGVAPNIIPDYAEIRMYVRAKEMDYLKIVEQKVKDCAIGAAQATGAKVKFKYSAKTYANMVTNKTMAQSFAENLEALGRKVSPPELKAGGGSTDMGNVSQVVPSIHPYIAICNYGEATGHSKEFAEATISEMGYKALIDGAKALAMTTIDMFTEKELLTTAKKEHTETVK